LTKPQQDAIEQVARRLEPTFWANTTKVDVDSMARLKSEGMAVVPISPAMASEMRTKTASMTEAFMKSVPATEKALRGYLADVKRA
jgi:TRAP-type C4-dicarboxylate transport system substrate-binding protein